MSDPSLGTETRSVILDLDGGSEIQFDLLTLQVQEGPDEGVELVLRDRPVVIGRGDSADLQLADGTVSREHLVLEPVGARWRLRDLGSKAGTLVGGARVDEAEVGPGTSIRLGATRLELRAGRARLKAAPHPDPAFRGLLGSSPAMRRLFGLARRVAEVDLPVLLQGESGTGKESLARALHDLGPSPGGPYEIVDCTVLGSSEHMRSELFGHVKGAFTGADAAREGAFVRADGGTLFLDEVGELPLDLQPQLLRALEVGEVRPLGGSTAERVRVRVVAATHRDLASMVQQGLFRQDLFYRLSALTLPVPPLRERAGDLPVLARAFLPEGRELAPEALAALEAHPWPGNVRELRNVVQQAATFAAGPRIGVGDLTLSGAPAAAEGPRAAPSPQPAGVGAPSAPGRVMKALEEEAIRAALARFDGNRNKAAEFLGISRATLFRRLKRYGIS